MSRHWSRATYQPFEVSARLSVDGAQAEGKVVLQVIEALKPGEVVQADRREPLAFPSCLIGKLWVGDFFDPIDLEASFQGVASRLVDALDNPDGVTSEVAGAWL